MVSFPLVEAISYIHRGTATPTHLLGGVHKWLRAAMLYGKPDSHDPFANFTHRNSNSIWQIPEVRLQILFSIFEIQNLYC